MTDEKQTPGAVTLWASPRQRSITQPRASDTRRSRPSSQRLKARGFPAGPAVNPQSSRQAATGFLPTVHCERRAPTTSCYVALRRDILPYRVTRSRACPLGRGGLCTEVEQGVFVRHLGCETCIAIAAWSHQLNARPRGPRSWPGSVCPPESAILPVSGGGDHDERRYCNSARNRY